MAREQPQKTLDEFKVALDKLVEDFYIDWHANNLDRPADYPAQMSIGDWHEQFMTYIANKAGYED